MEKLRNSPAVLLKDKEISIIEMGYLDKVFDWMISHDTGKPQTYKNHISDVDVRMILQYLGVDCK